MRGDFLPLLAIGAYKVTTAPIVAASDYLDPVTQVGALGLLGAYLWATIRERKEERKDRSEFNAAERSARMAEIKALSDSHLEALRHHTEAIQRAYERFTIDK